MAHTACAIFTWKDEESKQKFMDWTKTEEGFKETREFKGCVSIEVYERQENPLSLVVWQKWETQEDHEKYVEHRKEQGVFDMFGPMFGCPPEISELNKLEL